MECLKYMRDHQLSSRGSYDYTADLIEVIVLKVDSVIIIATSEKWYGTSELENRVKKRDYNGL